MNAPCSATSPPFLQRTDHSAIAKILQLNTGLRFSEAETDIFVNGAKTDVASPYVLEEQPQHLITGRLGSIETVDKPPSDNVFVIVV
jgi:hypothetical protein